MSDAEFIKAPNNLRKAKIGEGKAQLDRAVLERAEKVVEKIQSDYTDWADEDLASLEARFAELKAGKVDQTAGIKDLYRISLDLKGAGGSFGYLMMSEVAGSLNDFLGRRSQLSALDMDVIAQHITTLRAIYGQSVRDDGGRTGRALLVGLEKLVAKADAAAGS